MSCELIDSPHALDPLVPEWTDLLARSAGATAFQSPAWLIPWFLVWGRDRTRIVTIRNDDGRLIALLPAVHMNGRLELAGSGVSDYLAPLIDPTGLGAVRQALNQFTAPYSCLFHDVPADVPWPRDGVDRWRSSVASTCPGLMLPPCVVEFKSSLPHGLQRNLRRYGDRLRDDADAQFETVRDAVDAASALDALFRLHGLRWHERGAPGIFLDGHVREFHRLAFQGLLKGGLLRLHVVRTADTIVGAQYVLCCRGKALSYIGGFDPSYNRYSPGALLMAYSIEQAIDAGDTLFDFLRGNEAYKYTWGAVDRQTQSFTETEPRE